MSDFVKTRKTASRAIRNRAIRPKVSAEMVGHVIEVARKVRSDCTSRTRDSDSTRTSESIWLKLGIGIDGVMPKVDRRFGADCASRRRDIDATKSKERRAHNLLKPDKGTCGKLVSTQDTSRKRGTVVQGEKL